MTENGFIGTQSNRGTRTKREKKMTRGLSEPFTKAFATSGLFAFYEANSKDLLLGIRNEYVNIYYKGASVCKVEYDENSGGFSCETAKKYLYGEGDYGKKSYETVSPEEIEQKYHEIIKKNIENIHSPDERVAQQELIMRNNANAESKWFCVDLEYVKQRNNRGEKPYGRFDIIAISKKPPYQVALIELKYGADAIGGKSGIVKHANDFAEFNKSHIFTKHMKNEIVDIVRSLGTMNVCPITISDESEICDTPKFYFITLNNNPKTAGAATPKMKMGGYVFLKSNPKYSKAGSGKQSSVTVQLSDLKDITDPENDKLYAQFLFSTATIDNLSIKDIIDDPSYDRSFGL